VKDGGEVVQLMDFITLIEKNLNKKAKIKFLGMQAGDVKDTVASTKLSEKEIAYKAKTNIEKGVKNFCDWVQENKNWLLKLKPGRQ
jgi:UDP-glucuronate 4-epimerase